MIVHLVRHGQSFNTHPTPGESDPVNPPLTPIGRHQAELVAARLGRLPIDRILTSPMIRTIETANAIATLADRPVEVWPRCHEWRDTPGYPCAGGPELRRLFPSLVVAEEFEPNGWFYGGEPLAAAVARVDELLAWLRAEAIAAPTGRVVVVSHGNFIRTLVARILGAEPLAGQLIEIGNASVTTLDLGPAGIRLHGIGEAAHLADEPAVDPAAEAMP